LAVFKKSSATSRTSGPSSRRADRKACSEPCCARALSCRIHPVGFLVITKREVYGFSISLAGEAVKVINALAEGGVQVRPDVLRTRRTKA
jgi:hypothetical protein